MANVIPFEGGALPSYLKHLSPKDLNADLLSHAGAGFPHISIKGKTFAVVRDGVKKIIPNPKDPDSAASAIDMVLVKVNGGVSKVFYAKGYSEGADSVKPDCWSGDGQKPDKLVENPQNKTCATCKQNEWGSKIGDNGKKLKACQDSVRMAIATPDRIDDPYLLRVPPASIRPLGEYGKQLQARGVGYNMVITRIGFDIEAPTPQLTFKPVGFIDEQTYKQVTEVAASDKVQNILGFRGIPAEESAVVEAPAIEAPKPAAISKSKEVTEAEVEAVIAKASGAAPKIDAAAVEVDVGDLSLGSLSFDD